MIARPMFKPLPISRTMLLTILLIVEPIEQDENISIDVVTSFKKGTKFTNQVNLMVDYNTEMLSLWLIQIMKGYYTGNVSQD